MNNYGVVFRQRATPNHETLIKDLSKEDAQATATAAIKEGYQKVQVVKVI